jgi:hypothetical protein
MICIASCIQQSLTGLNGVTSNLIVIIIIIAVKIQNELPLVYFRYF